MRIRAVNAAPPRARGTHVLYWMTSARRLRWNYGLQRAAEIARERNLPLLVLEALRCGYPWASDRLHQFVIDGMSEHAAAPQHYAYVEPEPGAGKGLLQALAKTAAAVPARACRPTPNARRAPAAGSLRPPRAARPRGP